MFPMCYPRQYKLDPRLKMSGTDPGSFLFPAGFRPRTTRFLRQAQDRLFCFCKRTQNHWRPCVALRVPLPQSRLLGLRNSLRSDSPRPQRRCGTGAQPRPQALGTGLCFFRYPRHLPCVSNPRVGRYSGWKHKDPGTRRGWMERRLFVGRFRRGPFAEEHFRECRAP